MKVKKFLSKKTDKKTKNSNIKKNVKSLRRWQRYSDS